MRSNGTAHPAAAGRRRLRRRRDSAVRKLFEAPAPLQRQRADGIMAVTFLIAPEAGALDQKARGGLHAIAAQTEAAMIEWQHGIVRELARGGENRDAVGF